MKRDPAGFFRKARLWLMTALAVFVAGLAVHDALAQEPALQPPRAALSPSSVQPEPQATAPEFYLIRAQTIEQINAAIETQEREIKRLRAITEKGSCS